MIQVTPVFLCGGSGTRLWPLSRTGFLKLFLCLTGKNSLFKQAACRADSPLIKFPNQKHRAGKSRMTNSIFRMQDL